MVGLVICSLHHFLISDFRFAIRLLSLPKYQISDFVEFIISSLIQSALFRFPLRTFVFLIPHSSINPVISVQFCSYVTKSLNDLPIQFITSSFLIPHSSFPQLISLSINLQLLILSNFCLYDLINSK